MLAIFTSMSLKRARKTTCGVLDQFAPRIGADVWQANLTEAAIETVRKALRRSASKDTSVACFCLRTRHSLQLQWIVGNRRHFSLKDMWLSRAPQQAGSAIPIHAPWSFCRSCAPWCSWLRSFMT